MRHRWLVSNVIRCIGRIVTIFALCCAIGLHWLTLQSIAWTSMIIDYSKHGTLCEAIKLTFDGAHPCSLCHIVDRGKTTEKKSDLQLLTPKIDMFKWAHLKDLHCASDEKDKTENQTAKENRAGPLKMLIHNRFGSCQINAGLRKPELKQSDCEMIVVVRPRLVRALDCIRDIQVPQVAKRRAPEIKPTRPSSMLGRFPSSRFWFAFLPIFCEEGG